MKASLFLIALCFAGTLISCEKIDPGPETGGPDPIATPVLWLWPGQDTLVQLPGDLASYTVSSDNEEIAALELHEGGLTIKAGRPGVTRIYIGSKPDESNAVEVRSQMIEGNWESITDDEKYTNRFVVEAEDAAFAEELTNQLQEETAGLLGFIFRPYYNTSTGQLDSAAFAKVIHGTPPEIVQQGDYTLGDLELTLSPLGDQAEETYRLLPYPDREVLGLQTDLTARYQELYPDKGIQKVSVTLHLRMLRFPG